MNSRLWFVLGALAWAGSDGGGQIPVLKRSDVVFMYQADRATYQDYGATALAWGGRPNAASLEAATGVKFFGSVGMVTEFNRYYERFPQTYEQGLCRDLEGKPYKVPWLTDHQHKGVPYWWCCTRQPLFRQYVTERVTDTLKAGAYGVHIDDHLGTAGSLFTGGCFCDHCLAEFPAYLGALSKEELSRLEIPDPATFNFGLVLKGWLAQKAGRKVPEHPLWTHWRAYQLRGAASFMMELRALAARTAGRPVPMSANAGLLWPTHLSDYLAVDFFSAEIDHGASKQRFINSPLVAYRLADAVGRPLAATASGGDWAFIKEQNRPGLVQGWIALGYAAGNCLMTPVHQWCYTPEKGTHWYDGPKEKFAPLYRFAREHPALFDDYEAHADLTVVFAHRTFCRDTAQVMNTCNRLFATNLSYRIVLGGDEVVDHPLPAGLARDAQRLLVIEPKDFLPADQKLLAAVPAKRRLAGVEQAIAEVKAAARLDSPAPVRLLPRVKQGSAVVHLLNWNYDPASDTVPPIQDVRVELRLRALGVAGATRCRLYRPGTPPLSLAIAHGKVRVPELGIWAILELQPDPAQAILRSPKASAR